MLIPPYYYLFYSILLFNFLFLDSFSKKLTSIIAAVVDATVATTCEGDTMCKSDSILVKDAHGSARTINPLYLPENTSILRGWARDPHIMMAGIDQASISIHPNVAIKKIKDGVKRALTGDLNRHLITLPNKFKVEIKFRQHYRAYKASFYPGVEPLNSQTIQFETNDYYEFLRMFFFI